ncbi:hypothetical protein B9Z55_011119 [Caenorhabditis nigoni]|uniref:Uncharacterized protein n=1 Tax=Caenorhabditis nigoni TaxID=1611254 RepID=A0A2G5UJB9_9PELO|nr:hypothetical protein B9Z55_011119 [Caenorhabditis nigoni]
MDTEKDEDQRWIKFEEHMRKVIKEYREERRAKRREERIKIKESIRQQKKVWKLAQDRALAAKIKDRRYRKKIRASRRNKVKWLKKRNWIPMRIFCLIFWVRPIKMLKCNAPQVFNLGPLSIAFHVSISRSRKKKKKISSLLIAGRHGYELKGTRTI